MSEQAGTGFFQADPENGLRLGRKEWGIIVTAAIFVGLLLIFTSSLSVALLPIIVVCFLGYVLINPTGGLVAFVFLQSISRSFGGIGGAFLSVNRLLVVWVLIALVIQRLIFKSGIRFFAHPLNWIILLSSVWTTITALLSQNFAYTMSYYPTMMGNFLFFFLLYQLIRTRRLFGYIYLGWPILLIGSGLLLMILHRILGRSVFGHRAEMFRAQSIASMDPNALACNLIFSVIMLGVLIWWPGLKRWHRFGLVPLVLFAAYTIFSTASRTGVALFVIAGAAFVYRHRRRIGFRRIAAGLIVISLLFLVVMPEHAWDRIKTVTKITEGQDTDDTSLRNRWGLLRVVPRVVARYPVFGAGPGNFAYLTTLPEFRAYIGRTGKARGFRAHNAYANMLGETGIIGFLLFLYMLWLVISDLRVCSRLVKGQEGTLIWCMVEAMIIVIPMMFLEAFTLVSYSQKAFWVMLSIPVIARRLIEGAMPESDDETALVNPSVPAPSPPENAGAEV